MRQSVSKEGQIHGTAVKENRTISSLTSDSLVLKTR